MLKRQGTLIYKLDEIVREIDELNRINEPGVYLRKFNIELREVSRFIYSDGKVVLPNGVLEYHGSDKGYANLSYTRRVDAIGNLVSLEEIKCRKRLNTS